MPRMFIALPLPGPLLRACLDVAETCPPGWARQDASQLHLTVRFLGAMDGHAIDDLVAALDRVELRPLRVGVSGVGHFDQGRQSALFARSVPRDPLLALHQPVDRAVTAATGMAPERRAYFPHITLARARRGAEPPARWIERHSGWTLDPVPVRHLALYESRLGQEGASYDMVASFAFPLSA